MGGYKLKLMEPGEDYGNMPRVKPMKKGKKYGESYSHVSSLAKKAKKSGNMTTGAIELDPETLVAKR